MSARPPIERACYWLAHSARAATTTLRGDVEADVVIVGGGFTGLWTAIHLKALEPRAHVVILEAERVGYGGSGRNAGMLLATIDHSHRHAVRHFGSAEAARLAALGRDNVDAMLQLLDERGIAADVERNGEIAVALDQRQLAGLRAEQACARSLGVDDLALLDRDAVQAEVHCARYHGGLLDPACGSLDPVKLVEGLAGEAERLGCTIYEATPVTRIAARGAGLRVSGEHGGVRARRGVLATNAYSQKLRPQLRHRFVPLYDYVLVSEPLSPQQRSAIGWRARQGIADARAFFNYYRLTADDRVLFGTSEAMYYARDSVGRARDHCAEKYQALRESFAAHFPALASVAFPYAWGGPIAATTRFTPFFGASLGGKLHHALGYTGRGIAASHLAGKILAHAVLARPSALAELQMVSKAPLPYPPEPLRRWAINAVTRHLRRVDGGAAPSLLLRLLDRLGIGLSS